MNIFSFCSELYKIVVTYGQQLAEKNPDSIHSNNAVSIKALFENKHGDDLVNFC